MSACFVSLLLICLLIFKIEPKKVIAKPYQRLNEMIGLKEIKDVVEQVIAFEKVQFHRKKLDLKEGSPEFEVGQKLKREFRDLYTKLSHDMLKEGGVIFVAPSATRQKTVFLSREVYEKKAPIIPTMSVLAIDALKDPKTQCDFLPMAILPPDNYKKGLNFFKTYKLIPGEIFTAEEIRKKYLKKDATKLPDFDWEFHKRIADKLPKKYLY